MPAHRPRIAYLGPTGTFCEQAVRTLSATSHSDLFAASTVSEALQAVLSESVALAVVPLENSVEGAVGATLDELAAGPPLMITAEVLLPVVFGLYTRTQLPLNQLQTVASHPHGLAQCRSWLRQHTPRAQLIRAASTADAAAGVERGEYDAAVCAPVAGQDYHLHERALDIGDTPDALTRFVQISRPTAPPPATGHDVTSVVVSLVHDQAGALVEALTQFSMRAINLTRIESRPTKQQLGHYWFFLDCEGHITDTRIGEALAGLRRVCAQVRFLGSYPRSSESVSPQSRSVAAVDDYDAALDWVQQLRLGHPS